MQIVQSVMRIEIEDMVHHFVMYSLVLMLCGDSHIYLGSPTGSNHWTATDNLTVILFYSLIIFLSYFSESSHIWLMSTTGYMLMRFLPAGQRGW